VSLHQGGGGCHKGVVGGTHAGEVYPRLVKIRQRKALWADTTEFWVGGTAREEQRIPEKLRKKTLRKTSNLDSVNKDKADTNKTKLNNNEKKKRAGSRKNAGETRCEKEEAGQPQGGAVRN